MLQPNIFLENIRPLTILSHSSISGSSFWVLFENNPPKGLIKVSKLGSGKMRIVKNISRAKRSGFIDLPLLSNQARPTVIIKNTKNFIAQLLQVKNKMKTREYGVGLRQNILNRKLNWITLQNVLKLWQSSLNGWKQIEEKKEEYNLKRIYIYIIFICIFNCTLGSNRRRVTIFLDARNGT